MGLPRQMCDRDMMGIAGSWLRFVLWATRRSLSRRFVLLAMKTLESMDLFSIEVSVCSESDPTCNHADFNHQTASGSSALLMTSSISALPTMMSL